MLRRDRVVFFFGTAMAGSLKRQTSYVAKKQRLGNAIAGLNAAEL